jgi:hypothetical protein
MKEHAQKQSTKPLSTEVPGEITVGNILFVELNDNVKKPLLVYVDVNTKLIKGMPLLNKTGEECTKGLLDTKSDYQMQGRMMRQLVFDHEPRI